MRIVGAMAVPLLLFAAACQDGLFGPSVAIEFQTVDSTFQFHYADFNVDMLHPLENPAPEQQFGQLLYQASVVPTDTSLPSDPMSLWVNVNVRNPTLDSVGLPVRGCTVWPEVFIAQERAGNPLWVPGGECAQQPYLRVIAPGDTAQFSFLAYDVMLADALAEGRYYWNAQFRRQTDTLTLRAGSGDVRLRVPGLRYRINVKAESHHIVSAQVVLTNMNREVTRITYAACALSLAVYLDADRTDFVGSWNAHDVCRAYLKVADLAPADSLQPDEFVETFPVERLTDMRLDADRYYLSLVLQHNCRTYEFPVGTVKIS